MNGGEQFVERSRRAARDLHRALGAADAGARAAAVRFTQLPRFAATSLDELVAARASIRRGDALEVIALEAGFAGWAQLLAQALPELQRVTMYTETMAALLNRWFATYDDALASRRLQGGWLLPYRRQFVVVEAAAITELGLDPGDPDWARIGFDWVRPADAEAWHRLLLARWHVMLARGEPLG